MSLKHKIRGQRKDCLCGELKLEVSSLKEKKMRFFKLSMLLIPLCFCGCLPIAIVSLGSAFSGASAYAEFAETISEQARESIITEALSRLGKHDKKAMEAELDRLSEYRLAPVKELPQIEVNSSMNDMLYHGLGKRPKKILGVDHYGE